MPMDDPTGRQNSPIQGIYTLPLDSLTSIPLAFQMHPSDTQQTRWAVPAPGTAAALLLLQ